MDLAFIAFLLAVFAMFFGPWTAQSLFILALVALAWKPVALSILILLSWMNRPTSDR